MVILIKIFCLLIKDLNSSDWILEALSRARKVKFNLNTSRAVFTRVSLALLCASEQWRLAEKTSCHIFSSNHKLKAYSLAHIFPRLASASCSLVVVTFFFTFFFCSQLNSDLHFFTGNTNVHLKYFSYLAFYKP